MFIRIPSVELLRFLLIGLVAGWIMGKIRRGKGYGFIGNLVVGAIGSIIGWFLKGLLHLEISNTFSEIALAVAGAIIFFLLVGTLKGKRSRKSREE
jgi:uncharacterized membrane protein YeaQ/YmgE (transglycosylase-associated protein family)